MLFISPFNITNMKKYTIEDLRKGKVILINDGDLKVCQKVLKEVFPEDGFSGGHSKYYMANLPFGRGWVSGDSLTDFGVTLPSQSLADFLEGAWSPKEGELVEVSDNKDFSYSLNVVFIAQIKHDYGVITVNPSDGYKYLEGKEEFKTSMWKYVRQIKSKEVTLAEIAEKFGCEVSELKITDHEN